MNHMTQAAMHNIVTSGVIKQSEMKAISHIKPKIENRIPNGTKVEMQLNNVYIANKVDDGVWEIQMQGGSEFLQSICIKSSSSLANAISNLASFDSEGGGY